MLWISSVISTVLPTPAPPNSPALPPRSRGASRSMALMPVSKTSHAAEHAPAHRHPEGPARVERRIARGQPLGGGQRDPPRRPVVQVLEHLDDDAPALAGLDPRP
jgi:hypothetical protein